MKFGAAMTSGLNPLVLGTCIVLGLLQISLGKKEIAGLHHDCTWKAPDGNIESSLQPLCTLSTHPVL